MGAHLPVLDFTHFEGPIYWFYNIDQEQRWNQSRVFPAVTDLEQMKLVYQQEQQLFFCENPNALMNDYRL
ncbi:hypothetical protein [Paenibacillus melissococcoides]|uniref:hypothetical protein n=1 Tax=Paenibacillus melissococcoides TaxID=2912268 RepID=UPI0038B3A80C